MNTLYTTLGRCNPPTPFHFYLMHLLLSKEGDKKFYLSSTIDKKNPLSYEAKKTLFEYVYPEAKDIISNECNNFVSVLKKNSGKYTHMVFYCGIDRAEEYKKIADKYNHKEFDYDNIEVIPIGTPFIRGLVAASTLRQSFFDGCDLYNCFSNRYLRMKYDIEIHLGMTFPFTINTVSSKIYKALEDIGYRRNK